MLLGLPSVLALSGPALAGYEFSVSASSTDPSAHTAEPADSLRSLYLWVTCAEEGISALEAGVTGTLRVLGFHPLHDVVNLGGAEQLMLGVPGCPSGPEANTVLGYWIVWDSGGRLCLEPSERSGWVMVVECGRDPVGTEDPRIVGFSSDGSPPCAVGLNGCAPQATGGEPMSLTLESPSFSPGEMIPSEFTCDGKDRSPELRWSGVPEGAVSLVLICDDPDAPVGTWDHWVLYDLPPERAGLPAGVPRDAELQGGGRHGKNGWGRLGYGGPCPPGGTHRYFFRLYALDAKLALEPGASKKEVIGAMEGHVLARAELMGRYRRR